MQILLHVETKFRWCPFSQIVCTHMYNYAAEVLHLPYSRLRYGVVEYSIECCSSACLEVAESQVILILENAVRQQCTGPSLKENYIHTEIGLTQLTILYHIRQIWFLSH